jgi:hypothetical protein
MSSLVDKLKTLISAGARGSRQDEAQPSEETGPPPEVSEATPQHDDVPEVTEAPLADQQTEAPLPAPGGRLLSSPSAQESPGRQAEPEGDLEERRVVDLLDDQSDAQEG